MHASTRSGSRAAGWPVAVARSQVWTSRSMKVPAVASSDGPVEPERRLAGPRPGIRILQVGQTRGHAVAQVHRRRSRRRGQLAPGEGGAEVAGAADEVVEQRLHVPVRARGRQVQLVLADGFGDGDRPFGGAAVQIGRVVIKHSLNLAMTQPGVETDLQRDSRTAFKVARSLVLARRMAGAMNGASSFENPAGSPRLRSVMRVPAPLGPQV